MKLINALLFTAALLGLVTATAPPGLDRKQGVETRRERATFKSALLAKFRYTGLLAPRDDCDDCDDEFTSNCCTDNCCSILRDASKADVIAERGCTGCGYCCDHNCCS